MQKDEFNQVLADEEIGMCHLSKDGDVLTQNEVCHHICNFNVGDKCGGNCLIYFKQLSPSRQMREGFHSFEGKDIDGHPVDLMIMKSKNSLISCFKPLVGAEESDRTFVAPESLTAREIEIFKMRTQQRISVTEIAKLLNVSRATIRTHINNINKKLTAKMDLAKTS